MSLGVFDCMSVVYTATCARLVNLYLVQLGKGTDQFVPDPSSDIFTGRVF